MAIEITCIVCGKTKRRFGTAAYSARFCSHACRWEYESAHIGRYESRSGESPIDAAKLYDHVVHMPDGQRILRDALGEGANAKDEN